MKTKLTLICGLLYVMHIAKAQGPAVTFGIDLNSSYVFHGMTYNNGAVVQPFLSIAGNKFIYTMWSNYNLHTDDNGLGHFEANEFTEIDHFFTYLLPVKFLAMDATLGFYNYPGIGWESDKELQLGAERSLHNLFVPYARVGYMIDGAMEENLYIEFGSKGNQELNKKIALGYNIKASWERQPFIPGIPSGFKHLLATVDLTYMTSKSTGIVAKVNYVGQLNDEVLTNDLYDVSFHSSIGFFVNL